MNKVNMNKAELRARWLAEEQEPFMGWDFSYLQGRIFEDAPPWDYLQRAAELMRTAASVIDLDTGGGERFLELRPYWPPKVVVTEEYPPNVVLASERLKPLGVQVVDLRLTDFAPMPFAHNEFDLVLNRHAPFNADEVARILNYGGTFLTQQVHGRSGEDLQAVFDAKPQWPNSTLEKYLLRLRAAGLKIVQAKDWSGTQRFADVGAIVYYLKAVPWLVPDFSVEHCWDALLSLQRRVERGEELIFSSKRYYIEARKEQGAL